MNKITVQNKPSKEKLNNLGVGKWPIWEKEISNFPWTYDETETCYFLEGNVVVTPEYGQPVTMGTGDLVSFPSGMSCTWEVRKHVRKHYRFG